MKNKSSVINHIILGLAVFAYLLFLLTAFNSFYWMDDFWKRYEVLHQGFFSFQKEMYLNWDGRAISPIYSLRNLFLYLFDYPQAWAVTLIGMGFLTGTGYFSLRLVSAEEGEKWSIQSKILFTILFSIVLVMAFRPHISRSLYWGTGTYYMISAFFTVFTVHSLTKNPNSWWNVFLVALTCSSGPNNGLLILVFLVLANLIGLTSIPKRVWLGNILMGSIALAIVVLAPGNFARGGDGFVWSIESLLNGFVVILKEYLGMSLWVILGGILLGIFLDINGNGNHLKLALVFTFLGLASILPFLPFPGAASKHTAMFFQVFLLIGLIYFVIYFRTISRFSIVRNFRILFQVVFLSYFTYQITIQLLTGFRIKEQMDQRFMVLESNRGKNIELYFEPIEIPNQNWVSRFWDFGNSPTDISNVYYQKYFNIGRIYLVE